LTSNELCLAAGDEDWISCTRGPDTYYIRILGYRFSTEGPYAFSLDHSGDGLSLETSFAGRQTDTKLYLYGPDLTELAFDDDGGDGFFSKIDYTFAAAKGSISAMRQDKGESGTLTIYPVPTDGWLQVDIRLPSERESVVLEVVANDSRLISQETITLRHGQASHELDLSEQPRGMYFLRMISGSEMRYRKVILH
jgi:hypothetical protein